MLFVVIVSLSLYVCVRACRLSELANTHTHAPIQLATSSPPHVLLSSLVYLAALAFIIIDHHRDELMPNDFKADYKRRNKVL